LRLIATQVFAENRRLEVSRISIGELHMSNRTAKLVSAIFASLLAGAPFATVSHSAAAECLSGPKDQAPEGGHWYYRIEHPSERHCWYLRKEGEKLSQLASPVAPPAAKQVLPEPAPAIQRSIADAHAELPQSESATIWQPVPATTYENTPRASADVANPQASVQGSVIASRWPGGPDAGAPVSPQPVSPQALAASPAASASANPQPAAPRAVAAVPLAAADSSSKSQFGSIQMLLTIAMGALSLAAVMGSAVFGFGSRRWKREGETRGHRRVNWDAAGTGDLTPSAYRNTRMPGGHIPRDPRAADDPDRRIAEMLARLSRNAAA
jgi:hypothetical protein